MSAVSSICLSMGVLHSSHHSEVSDSVCIQNSSVIFLNVSPWSAENVYLRSSFRCLLLPYALSFFVTSLVGLGSPATFERA